MAKTVEEKLHKLAHSYAGEYWASWPTIRELAKRYKVRQADVIAIAEDSEKLDLVVGFQVSCSGHGELDESEYRVECICPICTD